MELLRRWWSALRAAPASGRGAEMPQGEAAPAPMAMPPAELPEDEAAAASDGLALAGGRRPAGMGIDAYVERQIQEAMRKGRFRGLPGAGKPLGNLDPDDPNWWLRRKLKDEGLDVPLPPALELQRALPGEVERLLRLRDEERLRTELERLNARIRTANARQVSGPPSRLAPLDVEKFVERWRAARRA